MFGEAPANAMHSTGAARQDLRGTRDHTVA